MSAIAAALGRLLLGLLFVMIGLPKIITPAGMEQTLAAASLPANLAMPIGVFEVAAGALLALGIMSRFVSILLAAYTLLTIFFFYNQFADPIEGQIAIHRAAIIGGLLVVFAYGQMRWSYDHIRTKRKGEVAAADANARAHEAELRAARAEGRAAALGTPGSDAGVAGQPAAGKRRWF